MCVRLGVLARSISDSAEGGNVIPYIYKIAPFCDSFSRRLIGGILKIDCHKHGCVDPVLFRDDAFGFFSTCEQCMLDHFNQASIGNAVVKGAGEQDCYVCPERNNLTDCETCGRTYCPKHGMMGVCSDCSTGYDNYR